jgi:ABC-type Fe3+-siderophore transport system permease subunit
MNKRIVFPLGLLLLFLFLDLFYTRGIGLFGDAMDSNVFQHFRLPRVLGAVFAGISLGISGLALQTLFRNPLAGPFLTGITPGASLGIALLLLGIPAGMSLGDAFFFSMSGAGLLGGMLVLLLQQKAWGYFYLIAKRSYAGLFGRRGY